MVASFSEIVVLTLGIIVTVLSLWGVVQPGKLMRFVTSTMDRPWGIYVAVIVRIVLGASLISAAPASSFPVTFRVLGIAMLIAAVALALAGRDRIRRLLTWWVERFSRTANRLWVMLGVLFGSFLVYGVL